MSPAPPIGMVSPAFSLMPFPSFLCSSAPPAAPIAAPMAVAAKQRRGEKSDGEADGAEPCGALLDRVVLLLDRKVALEVLVQHDNSPQAGTAVAARRRSPGVRRLWRGSRRSGRRWSRHRCASVFPHHFSGRQSVRDVPAVRGCVEFQCILGRLMRLDVERHFVHRAGEGERFQVLVAAVSTTPPLSLPISMPA